VAVSTCSAASNRVSKTQEEDKNESYEEWKNTQTNGDNKRTRCSLDLINVCPRILIYHQPKVGAKLTVILSVIYLYSIHNSSERFWESFGDARWQATGV